MRKENKEESVFSVLRLTLVSLFLCCVVVCEAQNEAALRDSLHQAADQLAFHPDSIELRMDKARWNMLLKQWDYAKAEYDYVLDRMPNHFDARRYRAYANEQMGRYTFARLDYDWALRLRPGDLSAMMGMALLLQKMQHYTEALDMVNRLVNAHPEAAEAYAVRAGIEKEREMFDLAVYDLGEAIKRDDTNKDYLLNRLELLVKLNRKEDADSDIKRLIQLGMPRPALKKYMLK